MLGTLPVSSGLGIRMFFILFEIPKDFFFLVCVHVVCLFFSFQSDI